MNPLSFFLWVCLFLICHHNIQHVSAGQRFPIDVNDLASCTVNHTTTEVAPFANLSSDTITIHTHTADLQDTNASTRAKASEVLVCVGGIARSSSVNVIASWLEVHNVSQCTSDVYVAIVPVCGPFENVTGVLPAWNLTLSRANKWTVQRDLMVDWKQYGSNTGCRALRDGARQPLQWRILPRSSSNCDLSVRFSSKSRCHCDTAAFCPSATGAHACMCAPCVNHTFAGVTKNQQEIFNRHPSSLVPLQFGSLSNGIFAVQLSDTNTNLAVKVRYSLAGYQQSTYNGSTATIPPRLARIHVLLGPDSWWHGSHAPSVAFDNFTRAILLPNQQQQPARGFWGTSAVLQLPAGTRSESSVVIDMSAALNAFTGNVFWPLEVFVEADYADAGPSASASDADFVSVEVVLGDTFADLINALAIVAILLTLIVVFAVFLFKIRKYRQAYKELQEESIGWLPAMRAYLEDTLYIPEESRRSTLKMQAVSAVTGMGGGRGVQKLARQSLKISAAAQKQKEAEEWMKREEEEAKQKKMREEEQKKPKTKKQSINNNSSNNRRSTTTATSTRASKLNNNKRPSRAPQQQMKKKNSRTTGPLSPTGKQGGSILAWTALTDIEAQDSNTNSPKTQQQQQQEEDDNNDNSNNNKMSVAEKRKKVGKFVLVTAVMVLVTFVASVIIAILNLSLLHTAMRGVVDLPDARFLRVMEDACNAMGAPAVYFVVLAIKSLVAAIGNFARLGADWNCGGALSMVSPFVLFCFVVFLLVLLQKDWLLALAIRFQARAKRHACLRGSSRLISFVLSMLVLYTLQIIIVALTDVVSIAWQIQRSCSAFDRGMVDAWDGLLVIFLLVFFYVAVLLFGTVKSVDVRGFTIEWVKGLFSIGKISFGIWDKSTFEGFHILDRADRFDNDDTDDNSHHETVMALTAQARGLIWVPIPFGIILTKCAHFLSDPPVLVINSKQITDLEFYTPYKKRLVLFVLNVLLLLFLLNTVFVANSAAVVALVCFIAISSIAKGVLEVYLFFEQL